MTGTSSAVLLEAEHTDEEVVQLILGGNTALSELLIRRHNERLYRAARAITKDDREAEDVSRARAALRRSLLKRTGATAPEAFRFYRPRCDRLVAEVLARISGITPAS
jgi:hypothetical protein